MNTDLVQQLNDNVSLVIGSTAMEGFEKAYLIATATANLKELLTEEYMMPIMALQDSRLGFKTDKQKDGGYKMSVVKECLIEAVLIGVQPFGNQFNIIQGNTYVTKEGFFYLLKKIPHLNYSIVPQLPRINGTSGAVKMNLEWTLLGESFSKELDIAVKVNDRMGTDGVIGKAERKARAWLYNKITGSEISDGDISDYDAKIMERKKAAEVDKEAERINHLIQDSKNIKDLVKVQPFLKESNLDNYNQRMLDLQEEELNK